MTVILMPGARLSDLTQVMAGAAPEDVMIRELDTRILEEKLGADLPEPSDETFIFCE